MNQRADSWKEYFQLNCGEAPDLFIRLAFESHYALRQSRKLNRESWRDANETSPRAETLPSNRARNRASQLR